jgi:signal transduction histidine kinase
MYADKGLAYEMRIAPEIALACEAQDLDELLGNLLDNASKWARQRVLVAADRVGPIVEMTIEDDGPGLSDQQAIDVMRLGHRLDEKRARLRLRTSDHPRTGRAVRRKFCAREIGVRRSESCGDSACC